MLPLPGLGVQTATTLLAEAGHTLATKNCAGLRFYSGVAPVTKQPAKQRGFRCTTVAIGGCVTLVITGLASACSGRTIA